jgi:hypothetical protein
MAGFAYEAEAISLDNYGVALRGFEESQSHDRVKKPLECDNTVMPSSSSSNQHTQLHTLTRALWR